jgi:signal transducing adaptor molecule
MSQPPQPAYGGRPAYGAYNAPPPTNYAGYPPVASTPQQGYGGAPPQHSPPSQVPPVSSGPAFFMVSPGEQRTQQQTPKPGPPSDPYALPQGRVPVGGRPQSYAPQELATGQFNSPVDNPRSFHAPQGGPSAPQSYDYPPTSQQSAPQQGPPQGQQNPYEQLSSPPPQQPSHDQQPPSDPYSQQPPQQGFGYPPSQPGYAPPAPPAAASSPAPAQGYLPYRPGGQAPSAPPVGGDDASGFYR